MQTCLHKCGFGVEIANSRKNIKHQRMLLKNKSTPFHSITVYKMRHHLPHEYLAPRMKNLNFFTLIIMSFP